MSADGKRLDVRKMLMARGWKETAPMHLEKGDALWACWGTDSGMDCPARRGEGTATLSFSYDVPARVIVAACESAARP